MSGVNFPTPVLVASVVIVGLGVAGQVVLTVLGQAVAGATLLAVLLPLVIGMLGIGQALNQNAAGVAAVHDATVENREAIAEVHSCLDRLGQTIPAAVQGVINDAFGHVERQRVERQRDGGN